VREVDPALRGATPEGVGQPIPSIS
jgi:hypothetical protein